MIDKDPDNILSRFSGCLVGGAVGDALGAPVEFMPLDRIVARFGPEGITEYHPAYGKIGAITDDTQMTLFTAEGLILHRIKYGSRPVSETIYQAYLRWLSTQYASGPSRLTAKYGSCMIADGILTGFKDLNASRAPGNSCLSALESGLMGTVRNPINNSKGCGGVMRIAPVGLALPNDRVFDTACDAAAITHGHPTGYLAAGCLAQIVSEILSGHGLPEAVEKSSAELRKRPNHRECLEAIQTALEDWENAPVSFKTVERIGQGWIAEEALAIGLYCALVAGDDFEKAVWLAVNHGGDSDSTGAIAGNIMGAMFGLDAIPQKFLANLELKDVILEIAKDLFENTRFQ